VRKQPRQTLIKVHELARQALFLRGTRGEAREAAVSILNICSERRRWEVA
jgi:hypothetical protein